MNTADLVKINKSLLYPDDYVVRMRYEDKAGVVTERVVSPIRFVGDQSILALCLCRETPRRFDLDRCSGIELLSANEVLMPVEIRVIDASNQAEECRPDMPVNCGGR